ncbi:MAG: hypothetical protein CMO74_13615 [Verrucomicrobiales bacterium]|nr:hypothetical protein [Verrucomicrobiales bacterium]
MEPNRSPLLLLLSLHLKQLWRKLRDANERSGSLTWLIVGFVATYPIIAMWLFSRGLRKLNAVQGIGPVLIEELVFLLFAFLFMMLLFSNVVVGYTNFFRNKESVYLFTLPIPASGIFRWKFIESTCIASWAFLLLVAPLLAAYGMQQKAEWHFYVLTPILVGLFIILPAVLGCWTAILLARHLDRKLFQIGGVLVAITIVLALRAYLQPEVVADESLIITAGEERSRLLAKTRFVQFPFMPSYWLSRSVSEWKDGVYDLSVFYLLVLLSNVLFFGFLGFTRTGKYFYSALSTTLSRGSLVANWAQLIRHGGRACAGLTLLSFFLPYLSLQDALNSARNEMTRLGDTKQNPVISNRADWPTLRATSPRAYEFSSQLTAAFDQLALNIGPQGLGHLGAQPGQIKGVRPAFTGLPQLVDQHLGFVDLKPVDAEFSLRIRDYFQANLSGLALALGATPITKPLRLQPVPRPVITAAAISPDGQHAAAAWPGHLAQFQPDAGDSLTPVQTPFQIVTAMQYSPDGKTLALAGITHEGQGRIQFRKPTGEIKRDHPVPATALCAAYSPDGSTLAVGLANGSTLLLPTQGDGGSREFQHDDDRISGLAWSPDGNQLVVTGLKSEAHIIDLENPSDPSHLFVDADIVSLHDGQRLLTGQKVQNLTTRLPHQDEQIARAPREKYDTAAQTGDIYAMATLPGHERFAVAGDFPGAYLIQTDTLEPVQQIPGRPNDLNTAVSLNANGERLILGSRDGLVEIHDLSGSTPRLVRTLQVENPPPPDSIGPSRSLLFLIPVTALAALVANRPAVYLIGGLMPFAIIAWIFAPAQSMPASSLWGIGLWLALLGGTGQLASLTSFWETSAKSVETRKQERFRHGPLDRLSGWLPLISPDTRALLLKDIRVFCRDTAQWGQSLMLFGILGLYFMNMHYFTQKLSNFWIYVITYMNFAVCALNLATLTTRFVYPQFSLEGKRVWIIGLAPMGLVRVVLVKVGLATAISLLVTLPLIWLSCHMLDLPIRQTLYFIFAITLMALTLNSLAVGMGVLYPNLKEDNPSKIVSGFGGTFCLVLSFVYIGACIMFLGMASPWGSPWHLLGMPPLEKRLVAFGGFLLLSLSLGLFPLLHARDKVTKMEH